MLPVLWGISNRVALPLSAGLAVAAFATIRYRLRDLASFPVRRHVGIAAIALVVLIALGRSFIPPAPLRVLRADFGGGIDRAALRVTEPFDGLPAGWTGRVYAVTAVYAPLGLRDRLQHRWYQDGRLVYSSPSYLVAGGRGQGFRLWTSGTVTNLRPGSSVRVDVRTEAGQLVGRAQIRVAEAAFQHGYN
jgi:hypothetical protein